MKILVLNCGSSSIKYQLLNMEDHQVLAEGIAERIGEEISLFTYKSEKYTKKKRELIMENHEVGLQHIVEALIDPIHGILTSINEIEAIGHRIVHGGDFYSESVIVTDEVIKVIEDCCKLAPLHNPAHLMGIHAVTKYLPTVPQVVVFDTAFHQTMPEKAYLYALPLEYYTEHKIRRYGFHGTSHSYVSKKAAKYLGKPIESLKMITCHIGNGASITAIDRGKSVDTSMGFTPLEGLVMGTRCGDMDPAIVIHMVKELGMTIDEVNNIMNKKSGMLGLSKISNDMREIEEEILDHNNPRAITAHDVYAYRVKKYIGAYAAVLNGVDVIVFTGGVGENMPILRELACSDLDYLGVQIDKKANDQFVGGILELQSPESKVKVLKVPTNEELMIAFETQRLVTQ